MSQEAPSNSEIEYATQQIEEADRRIQDIHDRAGAEGVKLVLEEGESYQILIPSDGDGIDELLERSEKLVEIGEAESYSVETKITSELLEAHIQNIIIDCQLAIELSVKAMFKLAGKDHPFSHSISFTSGETQGFYHRVPDSFQQKDEIIRVIFLTQFWSEFYELAKYGAPRLNVRPEMIFTQEDGSRAIEDAEFCVSVAKSLLDYYTDTEGRSTVE